jgi:hypothetical protein
MNNADKQLYNLFYNVRKHGDDVARLKKKLSSYLRNQHKTIVFFIDNLDRANDDNVIYYSINNRIKFNEVKKS